MACGSTSNRTPQPATLIVSIPPPTVVAPKCLDPVARLTIDGSVANCPLVTHQASPSDPVTNAELNCIQSVGLQSATPYHLVIAYQQASVTIAQAVVAPDPATLVPGLNRITVEPGAVTTVLDANGNGTPDIQATCP